MLLSDFVVWYLFLGGLGSGIYVVAFAIHTMARFHPTDTLAQIDSFHPTLMVLSLGTLVVGSICLIGDLTRPYHVLSLFLSPSFSVLSIGALSLGALIVCVAIVCVKSLSDKFRFRDSEALRILEALTCLVALVVATYTGIYLYQIPAVPLWNSLAIPPLFLISSLSTGMGALFIVAALSAQLRFDYRKLRFILISDAVLVALEIIFVSLFVAGSFGDSISQMSIEILLSGSYSQRFFVGFVVCGLIVPIVGEAIIALTKKLPRFSAGFLGGCILIAGFYLRSCIIAGGIHLSMLTITGA